MFQLNILGDKIHFIFNNFFSKNGAVYEIVWKSTVEADMPHMIIIRRMVIAC